MERHDCRLCGKSFSSGRSLGGHMRSHLTNSSADSEKPMKGSLPPGEYGYGLRENPKKTRRGLDFGSGDPSSGSQPCVECGRKFGSWEALFAHMRKCHQYGEEEDGEIDCRDSALWSRDSSSSDDETCFPTRKKRSQRRKRYGAIKVLNSYSSNCHKPEIRKELEEVAMCLMMLSRDASSGGSDGVMDSSVADSSDNYSVTVLRKDPMPVGDRDSQSPLKKVNARSELSVSGISNNRLKLDRDEVGITKTSSGKNLDGIDESQLKASNVSSSLSKMKLSDDHNECREREVDRPGGFECNTCNKTFSSYQALGGHRASHRKSKASLASKSETDRSPEAMIADSLDVETVNQLKKKRKKIETKGDGHECPICLRVFSSGQALGGHKKSHMSETKTSTTTRLPVIPELIPVHQVRDFLDLNLPAPPEDEEEDDRSSIVKFKSWWVGTSHKQESIISLIS